jgi:hypothetical protein
LPQKPQKPQKPGAMYRGLVGAQDMLCRRRQALGSPDSEAVSYIINLRGPQSPEDDIGALFRGSGLNESGIIWQRRRP